MATEIIFTALGANSQFGSFAPGDRMRCHENLAEHLVNSGVAKYAVQPSASVDAPESSSRRRGKK